MKRETNRRKLRKIIAIIKDATSMEEAVSTLIEDGFCVGGADARRLYFQLKDRKESKEE